MKICNMTTARFGALVRELGLAPGSLFPLEFGNKGRIINAMLYDYWHGNGYKLDMLTGCFVEDKTTTPKEGTPPCNPPNTSKET